MRAFLFEKAHSHHLEKHIGNPITRQRKWEEERKGEEESVGEKAKGRKG